jgi:hypothetical protein
LWIAMNVIYRMAALEGVLLRVWVRFGCVVIVTGLHQNIRGETNDYARV